jgi:hypothetical protein
MDMFRLVHRSLPAALLRARLSLAPHRRIDTARPGAALRWPDRPPGVFDNVAGSKPFLAASDLRRRVDP